MSNISDIAGEEAAMPFEEKITWVSAGGRGRRPRGVLRDRPGPARRHAGGRDRLPVAADHRHRRVDRPDHRRHHPRVAIGTGISAEITAGSVDDIDRKDERDVQHQPARRPRRLLRLLGRRAWARSSWRCCEYDHFWIANALYLSFVIGALVSVGRSRSSPTAGASSHGQADESHQQHPRAAVRRRRDDPGGAGRPGGRRPGRPSSPSSRAATRRRSRWRSGSPTCSACRWTTCSSTQRRGR